LNVNDVVLYCIILGGGSLIYLAYLAHQEQKRLLSELKSTKERLAKLSNLIVDVEKVEHEMHKAAIEKVDKRNLELIIKETLDYLGEKRSAIG
jgi:hypothetical protein